MRDPLQKKKSPYEILEVPAHAGKKEIFEAFKNAVTSGGNSLEISNARKTLVSSVERGLTDIFLYNRTFIDELSPGLWGESSRLLNKRNELIQLWQNTQRKIFPHSPSTHSLALCSYRWALYHEEEKLAALAQGEFQIEASLSDGPALEELWSDTIAFWAFLINCEEFWLEWKNSQESIKDYLGNDDDIKMLCQKIEDHFINQFHNLRKKYLDNGDSVSAERFRGYELRFITEVKTARRLKEIGLQMTKGGKRFIVSCGQMMLQKLGILEGIQKQLDTLIKTRPSDEKLQKLAASLSPYSNISILIENKKYDEAIKAIGNLPPEQQEEKEVLSFLAKTYLKKGEQDFSLNQFDSGLDNWKKGIATGELKQEIRKAVISDCQTKAASLQRSDPETAIKILEKALKIITSKDLSLTLAEILTQKGIRMVADVQNEIKSGKAKKITQKMINSVEKGVTYLERAKVLGAKRASQNLQNSVNFLKQLRGGGLVLDPRIEGFIQKANQAANAKRWSEAINLLNKAKSLAAEGDKKTINKMLSTFYNARAVQNINAAMNQANTLMKQYQELAPKMIEDFILGGGIYSGKGKASEEKSKISWPFIVISIIVIIGVIFLSRKFGSDKLGNVLSIGILLVWLVFIIGPWIVETVGTFLKNLTKPIVTLPQYGYGYDNRPSCLKCNEKASYSYNLPNYGTVNLCSTHSSELRGLTNFTPQLSNTEKSMLESAESDLSKALELDPGFSVARKNLDQVKDIYRRFNVY